MEARLLSQGWSSCQCSKHSSSGSLSYEPSDSSAFATRKKLGNGRTPPGGAPTLRDHGRVHRLTHHHWQQNRAYHEFMPPRNTTLGALIRIPAANEAAQHRVNAHTRANEKDTSALPVLEHPPALTLLPTEIRGETKSTVFKRPRARCSKEAQAPTQRLHSVRRHQVDGHCQADCCKERLVRTPRRVKGLSNNAGYSHFRDNQGCQPGERRGLRCCDAECATRSTRGKLGHGLLVNLHRLRLRVVNDDTTRRRGPQPYLGPAGRSGEAMMSTNKLLQIENAALWRHVKRIEHQMPQCCELHVLYVGQAPFVDTKQ